MHTHTQWPDRRCIKHATQASLSLVARLPLVPPIVAQGQNSQVQTSALPPSDTSCCTEFQIPHPQPFSITMDNSTTGTHSVPVVGNSALESSLEVAFSQPQAWPPAPPPKAPATNEPRWGRARARSPLTEKVYVERMRSEAASVYHEAAPDGAAAGAASRVMPPPIHLQPPPDVGLIRAHDHYTRTRWAEWRDEFGRRWRISGVASKET